MTKHILLAYCIENIEIAQTVEKNFAPHGYTFKHITGSSEGDNGIGEQLESQTGKVLLLLSDNFLRNVGCMKDSFSWFQNLMNARRLLTVVIDGKKKENGIWKTIPTSFERVSNVIQYMNFWQDEYLELRKNKRNMGDTPGYDENLRIVRAISSEVGEFLRQVRSSQYFSYSHFKNNSFQQFFTWTGNSAAHANFKQLTPVSETPKIEIPKEDIQEVFSAKEKMKTEVLPVQQEVQVEPTLEASNDEKDFTLIEMEESAQTDESALVEEIRVSETNVFNISEDEIMQLDLEEQKMETENSTTLIEVEKLSEISKEEIAFLKRDIAESKIQESTEIKIEEGIEELIPNIPGINLLNNVLEEKKIQEENVEQVVSASTLTTSAASNFDDLINEIIQEELEEEAKNIETEEIKEELPVSVVEPEVEIPNEAKKIEISKILEDSRNSIEQGEIPDALNRLNSGIQKFPDEVNLRFYYSYILAKKAGKSIIAQKELNTVLKQSPQHIDGNYLAGELAEIDKNYWSAKNHYFNVISEDKDYPNAQFKLGNLLATKFANQEERALAHLKIAIKQDKNNAEALGIMAKLYEKTFSKPEKAEKYYSKVLKLDANNVDSLMGMARVSVQQNQQENGLKFYRQAVELNPNLATIANQNIFAPQLNVTHSQSIENQTESKIQELEAKLINLQKQLDEREKELKEKSFISAKEISSNGHHLVKNGNGNGATTIVNTLIEEKVEEESKKEEAKVVFITGATSGIGKATANLFAKNGYRVIMTGRRKERLEAQQKQLQADYQADIEILNYDVRDSESVKKAVQSLGENWKNVDILINNAGLAKGFSAIHEGEMHHWEQMIDTNIKGLLYMTRAITPNMVERKKGHIINVCSTAGHEVYPNGNVYCATKHAVDALTKSMRIDLHKHNVRVSQVSPGHVEETEFAQVRFDGDKERAKIYEDFRPLTSSDVAEAIFFMATRPSYVNIQDILMMGTQQANSNFLDRSGR